jgi:5S rRNA maturation endonuclease (ribonuclease M5)
MFRGWVVYTHRNQKGEVLTYSGRDVGFDKKWKRWIRDGKPESKKPHKHKYVRGYLRGRELFGQDASRLENERIMESLQRYGLFVVEGMNDVIRLDTLGIAAVGTCSNKGTDEQVQKIAKFARLRADGRVVLMPDCDDEGETGFKDLLWRLAEEGLSTRLAWSAKIDDGRFSGWQPEDAQEGDIERILKRLGGK